MNRLKSFPNNDIGTKGIGQPTPFHVVHDGRAGKTLANAPVSVTMHRRRRHGLRAVRLAQAL